MLPVFTMRRATHAHPVQNKGSQAFIERKLSTTSSAVAVSTLSAAKPCANFPPPNSRASRPAIHTSAAPAKAGSRRIAESESPSVFRTSQVTAAMSGG